MSTPTDSAASGGRILVIISGGGSNLQAIIDGCQQRSISGHICKVISNKPEAYGLTRAKEAGIPSEVLDHRTFSSREDYDLALMSLIAQDDPDLIVLAGFMRILTPAFVSRYVGKLLNIHPSLLPKYPGLNTHQRALDAGDAAHGATVHFVTEELDGGPPIIQGSTAINPEDTAASLAKRVQNNIEHAIYPLAVNGCLTQQFTLDGERALYNGEALPETGLQYPLHFSK